ncbi:MAG: hypothetical protein AB1424_10460 [Thermodesulfobacteriota bacterium]
MRWKTWAVRLLLLLWALQLMWLAWFFAPEVQDLAWRLASYRTGAAIRQEDPFYRWLLALAEVIPPQATYVFLDNYEAGKEIEARYHLTPRRHVLLPPAIPPDFLFYALRQEKASYLIIREGDRSWDSQEAVEQSPAFRAMPGPGPGLLFRVDYTRLLGRFYD